MFTGIIEGLGRVSEIRQSGRAREITLDADFSLHDTKPGDSIAVSGACLTATMVAGGRFKADLSPETVTKTTLGGSKTGDRVNLERALRFSDRLGGHLVAGHIDGIGKILKRETLENIIVITVSIPATLSRYLIEKGSVAVDGISLTVNDCAPSQFSVGIIPHTAGLTTLRLKNVGAPVNIETDMIGKYVERFLGPTAPGSEKADQKERTEIDLQLLEKTGFLDPYTRH